MTAARILWVATANRHKAKEIAQMAGSSVTVKSLADLPNFPEIEETGTTFLENARIKAQALWDHVRAPVIADDAGLEVDALGGRPGIYSARYSAPNPSYEKNNQKLLSELRGIPDEQRTARFRCVIVLLDEAGHETSFSGTLEGRIASGLSGKGGFGFDPVFWLPERSCTVAELSDDEKNAISHRGQAVRLALAHFMGLSDKNT